MRIAAASTFVTRGHNSGRCVTAIQERSAQPIVLKRSNQMRYIMRERILSLGDDFTIKDADGRDVYMSTVRSSASARSSHSKTARATKWPE